MRPLLLPLGRNDRSVLGKAYPHGLAPIRSPFPTGPPGATAP